MTSAPEHGVIEGGAGGAGDGGGSGSGNASGTGGDRGGGAVDAAPSGSDSSNGPPTGDSEAGKESTNGFVSTQIQKCLLLLLSFIRILSQPVRIQLYFCHYILCPKVYSSTVYLTGRGAAIVRHFVTTT